MIDLYARTVLLACLLVGCCLFGDLALALEDAKVLPAGVRRFTLRTSITRIVQKTGSNGSIKELEEPLEKSLSFRDFIQKEAGLERSLAEGFLLANGDVVSLDEPIGYFRADLKGELQVAEPILAWGITERLTLALAIPVYRGKTVLAMDFHLNSNARKFVSLLGNSYNNQAAKAIEITDEFNTVMDTLQNNLRDNGYRPLADWSATALGDSRLTAKALFMQNEWISVAAFGELVAPTGRVDDPNILTDVKFGDGQWDVVVGWAADQQVSSFLMVNEYVKYTAQLPDTRPMRRVRVDEAVQVPLQMTAFDLGDALEAGVSAQIDTQGGFTGGLGYVFDYKDKDRYEADVSASELSKNTYQRAHVLQTELGYSLVPVPVAARLSYSHIFASQNTILAHFLRFDLHLFF